MVVSPTVGAVAEPYLHVIGVEPNHGRLFLRAVVSHIVEHDENFAVRLKLE
jgi:hypothetical protein